jgi:hypothetical protein
MAIPVNPEVIAEVAGEAYKLLQSLGIQPSGTIKETNDYWCIFNNWQDRDKYAQAHGAMDKRFSTKTPAGGTWYCVKKG